MKTAVKLLATFLLLGNHIQAGFTARRSNSPNWRRNRSESPDWRKDSLKTQMMRRRTNDENNQNQANHRSNSPDWRKDSEHRELVTFRAKPAVSSPKIYPIQSHNLDALKQKFVQDFNLLFDIEQADALQNTPEASEYFSDDMLSPLDLLTDLDCETYYNVLHPIESPIERILYFFYMALNDLSQHHDFYFKATIFRSIQSNCPLVIDANRKNLALGKIAAISMKNFYRNFLLNLLKHPDARMSDEAAYYRSKDINDYCSLLKGKDGELMLNDRLKRIELMALLCETDEVGLSIVAENPQLQGIVKKVSNLPLNQRKFFSTFARNFIDWIMYVNKNLIAEENS